MAGRFGEALVVASETAQRWAMHDPDPITRGLIDALVDAGDPALIRLFEGRIAFGTAGLRAGVGAGPNQMNALVVRQTTAAVIDWLKAQGISGPRLVVGFDARHDSRRFAAHVAAAAMAAGASVLRADGPAPTPVMAHALLHQQADAAVVITASHNPPMDNGYKLYLGDGLQLVAPADAEIAAMIDELAAGWHHRGPDIDDAFAELEDDACVPVGDWIAEHRAAAIEALATPHRDVSIAYTAMHGVGGRPILDAFAAAGFPAPAIAVEQFEPDGSFPTVSFPNPEEPGALDQVLAVAEAADVDAAFANDPDADRLAIAVRSRDRGGYVALSGNQLGALLADHVLEHTAAQSERIVARSIVSSRLLDSMAAAADVQCEVTLTGFKWVARPIVSQPSAQYVFGFEEAIGYCVGDRVRDKDGVSAALVAAEMLATLKASGRTAWDRLDELAAIHGVHLNHPISVRFDDDPHAVQRLMDRISATPPSTLGPEPIDASGPVGFGSLPATAGLHMLTSQQTQVIIRPSGTEPKIKAYIEVIEPVGDRSVNEARRSGAERLDAIVTDVQALLAE